VPLHDHPDDTTRAAELSRVYAQYADPTYNARWALDNPGNAALVDERRDTLERLVADWARRQGRSAILDLGCGSTTALPPSIGHVPRIGLDLLFERLETLNTRHPDFPLICGDGAALPFRDGAFDAVVLSTVFSSVLDDAVRSQIAGEIDRVLRPGGAVIWYDMRLPNPRNRSVSPLSRRRIESLFRGYAADWRTLTLLPPVARRLGRRAARWYRPLAAIPLFRSHLAGLLVKPA
jgi:SAM-dependent methyltransferase